MSRQDKATDSYRPSQGRLLSTNAKLLKHNKDHYLITGLAIAPHTLGGVNVCPSSTKGCVSTCVLWMTGRTVMPVTRRAMLGRKRLLLESPGEFYELLHADITRHVRRAKQLGLKPAIRLNVASDLDWSGVAKAYPSVRFYDYTKVRSRLRDPDWPSNYELTYSLNERSHWNTVVSQLERGGNVAAVFSTRYRPQAGVCDPLPQEWTFVGRTYPVVDGDQIDVRLREVDGSGVIVGLRFKGSLKRRAAAIAAGFCLDVTG